MRKFYYIKDWIEYSSKQVIMSGEIEIPKMVLHQEGENIIEVEDFWS